MARNCKTAKAAAPKSKASAQPPRTVSGLTSDEERALYGSENLTVENCRFEGPADGESALKESRNCTVNGSLFALRYPFWHNDGLTVLHSRLTETCRAPFWYDRGVRVAKTFIHGVKAFRECSDVVLTGCDIVSAEFGWNCRNVTIGGNSRIESEYFLFGAQNVHMRDTTMTGKYSFQYVKGGEVRDCVLNTKDAFWHSENLTVTDCVINGEYLGWYAKNLRLIRCRITGTQPLCYCENLVLEDCTMDGCDLAFEYCTVNAVILGDVVSVKNPIHGSISADSIGEIILDEHRKPESDCVIRTKK